MSVEDIGWLTVTGPTIRLQLHSARTFCGDHLNNMPDVILAYKSTSAHSFGNTANTLVSPTLSDEKEKLWIFPLAHYDQLVEKLNKLPVSVQEIPKEVRTLIKSNERRKAVKAKEDLDFSGLPVDLSENLLPFQWKGIQFALEHDGLCSSFLFAYFCKEFVYLAVCFTLSHNRTYISR